MRTANKNKQNLMYAIKSGREPIYEKNADGTTKYIIIDGAKVPVETGDYEDTFDTPVAFIANISMSGGESVAVEYGLDFSAYDATILTTRGELPIKESDLIWFTSTPTYKDDEKTKVDPKSADYRVMRVTNSINASKYLLSMVVK